MAKYVSKIVGNCSYEGVVYEEEETKAMAIGVLETGFNPGLRRVADVLKNYEELKQTFEKHRIEVGPLVFSKWEMG